MWLGFGGRGHESGEIGTIAPFDLAMFGAASAVILALMAQIGEQVDFLASQPAEASRRASARSSPASWPVRAGWWWGRRSCLPVFPGGAGAELRRAGRTRRRSRPYVCDRLQLYGPEPYDRADPDRLLRGGHAAQDQCHERLCRSLAWSNFFSRLTHSHPGRVVWLFFNVAIALLLMEIGIYRLLEEVFGVFSIIAAAWLCTISADLFINKPLGLAPRASNSNGRISTTSIRWHGGMLISAAVALTAHFGLFGDFVGALAIYLVPVVAFIATPGIAWITKGKYYLARSRASPGNRSRPSPARSANIRSSRRTWPGARLTPRLSVRCAARSTAVATTSANPRPGSNIRRGRWRRRSCRKRQWPLSHAARPLRHDPDDGAGDHRRHLMDDRPACQRRHAGDRQSGQRHGDVGLCGAFDVDGHRRLVLRARP